MFRAEDFVLLVRAEAPAEGVFPVTLELLSPREGEGGLWNDYGLLAGEPEGLSLRRGMQKPEQVSGTGDSLLLERGS